MALTSPAKEHPDALTVENSARQRHAEARNVQRSPTQLTHHIWSARGTDVSFDGSVWLLRLLTLGLIYLLILGVLLLSSDEASLAHLRALLDAQATTQDPRLADILP